MTSQSGYIYIEQSNIKISKTESIAAIIPLHL